MYFSSVGTSGQLQLMVAGYQLVFSYQVLFLDVQLEPSMSLLEVTFTIFRVLIFPRSLLFVEPVLCFQVTQE